MPSSAHRSNWCSNGCRTAGSSPNTGALADAAVVGDLWSQFEQHGVEERHRVDAGDRDPAHVAEDIDRRLRAGELRLKGPLSEPGQLPASEG